MADDLSTEMMSWSRTYQDAAELLIGQAHADFTAGVITGAQYNDTFDRKYLPLIQAASNINNAAFSQLAVLGEMELGPIRAATAKLKAAVGTIDHVQRVVTLISELLGAVGLVATVVTAPTAATIVGAGAAVGSFTQDLVAAATKGK